jgi:hypothetical protein
MLKNPFVPGDTALNKARLAKTFKPNLGYIGSVVLFFSSIIV